jgi:hypothetical protein
LRIRLPSQCVSVDPLPLDLSTGLGSLEIGSGSLVTASALLDLVSADWLATAIRRITAAGAAALFALTYDGRIRLEPGAAGDALLRDLINRHQRGDKGFGPALGPAATAAAADAFVAAGYATWREPSDWQIDASEAGLQHALVSGWLDAAIEVDRAAAPRLGQWADGRFRQIDAGTLTIRVGHEDLLALPR